jgi:hypothetical protein
VATNDKDFVVKQGLKVSTGVTFSDGTVQTTAYVGYLDGGNPSSTFTFAIDGGSPSNVY